MHPMFIAAIPKIAKTQKQPKCPSIDEWTKKMLHIHNAMEYYSAIKRNEIMPFAATWMDLEIIILSEVNQGDKDKYTAISLMQNLKKKKIHVHLFTKQKHTNIEDKLVVTKGQWGGER